MTTRLFLFGLVGFLGTLLLTEILLPILRKLKFGQEIREEGNPEHMKKKGTPTMGGIAFLLMTLIGTVLFGLVFPNIVPLSKLWPILLMTYGFALVGFFDDLLKIKKKQSEGLKAWQKFLCQAVLSVIFVLYCYFSEDIGSSIRLPFTNKEWEMGWLYIPFALLAILGTDNGVNLTDGVDGLLSSVTIPVLAFLLLASGTHTEISSISAILIGALAGFLFFNANPAKLFMGDTGALGLGGFIAATALTERLGLFILIFGILYLVETLSVILQVSYFKLTHGKRIFKMSPLHHHFELSGYSETQIVTAAAILSSIACFVAFLAL